MTVAHDITDTADIVAVMHGIGAAARAAARELAQATSADKDAAIQAGAAAIRERNADILAANAKDMAAAEQKGISGALLDRLAAARNTIVGRVRYRVGELEPLIDEARQKAVKDARRRAALYAKSVGVRLGKVQRIVERGLRLPQPPRQASAGGRRGAAAVIPGRQEVRAIIGVTFAIR